MTEIREIDGERAIVTQRGSDMQIFALPPGADDALTGALLAAAIRRERDGLLAACDYIIMPDYPADDGERETWRAYRQALRDLPGQEGFPLDVAWPEEPGKKDEDGEEVTPLENESDIDGGEAAD